MSYLVQHAEPAPPGRQALVHGDEPVSKRQQRPQPADFRFHLQGQIRVEIDGEVVKVQVFEEIGRIDGVPFVLPGLFEQEVNEFARFDLKIAGLEPFQSAVLVPALCDLLKPLAEQLAQAWVQLPPVSSHRVAVGALALLKARQVVGDQLLAVRVPLRFELDE